MKRSFLASIRRANKMMGPVKMAKFVRSSQSAMSTFVTAATGSASTTKPSKTLKHKSGRKLGKVVKQLQETNALARGTGQRRRQVSPRIPAGAQYLSRTFRGATGVRQYKLYLPASAPKQPKGLILMLHGCGQTPDDFAVGTRMNALAEKHCLAVAWPAQTQKHNSGACWNWFKPGNQERGAGEPAVLAGLARKLARQFGLGRDATYVAGLSAGGAMAAILADVYPDVFCAAGIHSGLARGAARDTLSALSAMRNGGAAREYVPVLSVNAYDVRCIVFHGDADRTVHPSNAGMIVAASVGTAAVPTKIISSTVQGRGYSRSIYSGADRSSLLELWVLVGAGHAWSGGRAAGSYTDTKGPDASKHMVRFFLETRASQLD